ncbi:pyridoxamine 5'-phosphate oxidase family protein [uncultured Desulfosarcina sp.]|uniref:pyridoxamine 5'-phosphate oxidase family protein n=1 Tax=uncultured Desulfosarcina sp. TaxID=218289 RepID=UPI0029C6BFA1|nr:pyridoxamine 5'-phosphate oxidase family protein [uncultured Desulfosarcina sp.]
MTTSGKSTTEDWQQAARSLIQSESTLTLATAGESGPWSVPVYYVYLDNRFYFFSSPQSRHILQTMASGEAAASLFHQADSWQSIRGIQMKGTVDRIHSMGLSIKTIALYLKRFPFTREFFADDPNPDLDAFFSRFKARLYAFDPAEVYYIDNRFGFGTRQRIDW